MNQQQRLMVDSMGKNEKILKQPIKVAEMKTKNQILKWMAMLLLVITSTMGAMAQTSTTLTQDVCPGTEPYFIHPSNKSNMFLWSIDGGTSGIDWTISTPTDTITNIIWTNPATSQIYKVMFKEIDPLTLCHDDKDVIVTVYPKPDAPISSGDIAQCEELPIQILTATATAPAGSTVKWYTAAIDGDLVAIPTLSAVGTVTYYAESVVTTSGCTSLTRTPVTLTINPAPVVPISGGDIVACEQLPIQILTATATATAGSTVTWYSAVTGGTVIASPTLSAVGTITYYAESVVTVGGCTSLTRTPVVLTINPVPAAPTASNQTICSDGTLTQTLTATATAPAGSSVVWYNAATAGTVVTTLTQVGVGTVTYYAESVATTGTCPSLTRTPVVLTINPLPAAPTASNQTICSDGTLTQTLTATATAPAGSSVVWYNAATAGTVVTTLTQIGVGTVTYYAESIAATGTCPSLTRTPVVLTINPVPAAPTASNQTICSDGTLTQTLTATATAPAGSSVVWYNAATAGTVVTTLTQVGIGTVTYYAESVAATGTCPSLTRTPVVLTINPIPKTSAIFHN